MAGKKEFMIFWVVALCSAVDRYEHSRGPFASIFSAKWKWSQQGPPKHYKMQQPRKPQIHNVTHLQIRNNLRMFEMLNFWEQ